MKTVTSTPPSTGGPTFSDIVLLDARCRELEGTHDALRKIFDDPEPPRPTSTPNHLGYRCAAPVLVRAAHHAGLELPPWPDLSDPRQEIAWAQKVWTLPGVRDALAHASPDLARQLDQLDTTSGPDSARRVRRSVLALASYVVRMKGRPTPFGLLAGITEGRFLDPAEAGAGTVTTVAWGSAHRAKAWPGAGWLAEVINDLESTLLVRRCLKVVANNACAHRGERLVVPWTPRATRARTTTVCERAVRATPLVHSALRMARHPTLFADLAAKVHAEHPSTALDKVETALDELIEQRILLTSLHPPATEPDLLGHVLAETCRAGLEELPQVRRLAQIHALISQHDAVPATRGAELRRALTRRMNDAHEAPSPLALDLRLDGTVELPHRVARDIASAATALTRVTPHPHGTPAWRRYHQRFLDRYGDRATVPVAELLDPEVGLGLPEGYLGTEPPPRTEWSARDKKLLALAQSAARDGIREVELDEHLIHHLATGDPERMRAPAHLETAFAIHAASTGDIDRGTYSVTLTNVSRAWGTLTGGRFTNLLEHDGHRSAMVEALREVPTTDPDALLAQASSPALRPDAAHLTRMPQLLPALVSVSEHRDEGADTLPLSDLAVSADRYRMYLLARSTGRPVEVATLHPLQLEAHTPPVIRFLTEVTRARAAYLRPYTTFDWGPADCLPYLPGIRHGRVLLAPARWRLEEDDLPGRTATTTQWDQALAALRDRLGLPPVVRVSYVDLRLVLDLDEPLHRALLRRQIERTRIAPLTLDEAPTDQDRAWIGGRPHEMVALLKATPEARPWPTPIPAAPAAVRAHHTVPPGATERLCLRWPGRPRHQQEIVADHLPNLLDALGDVLASPPRWWYRCEEDHLLLTLTLPDSVALGAAAHRIGAWARDLGDTGMMARDGLSYVAYRPDTGRWGQGDALAAAEHVLAADSALFAQQLRQAPRPDSRVLTASNMVATANAFLDEPDRAAQWLIENLPQEARPDLPRPLVAQTIRAAESRELCLPAEAHRQAVTSLYRTVCAQAAGTDPDIALTELLHEHHLRAHGPTREHERDCRHLVRAVALSHLACDRTPRR